MLAMYWVGGVIYAVPAETDRNIVKTLHSWTICAMHFPGSFDNSGAQIGSSEHNSNKICLIELALHQ